MKSQVRVIVACCLVLIAAIWFVTTSKRDTAGPETGAPSAATPAPNGTPELPFGKSAAVPTSSPSSTVAGAQQRPAPAGQAAQPPSLPPSTPSPAAASINSNPPPKSSSFVAPPVPQETADAQIDLNKVSLMVRDYRTLMGENPVGTNAEIMKAIMGANPKGAKLGPPEGQSLNGSGELIDRWGTPYFFHQISGTQMEIWSAGPDRKMGTSDDLIQR